MNLYFRTAAGIVGISEAIISTVKDLQSPVGVVNCNICAAGGTAALTGKNAGKFVG